MLKYFRSMLLGPVPISALLMQFAGRVVYAAPFFPQLPSGTKTYTTTGVLMTYGVGMDSGGFTIQTSAGKTLTFAVGHNMKINGTLVQCVAPNYYCPSWPSSIMLGTTNVQVTYWKTVDENGTAVNASSEIDTAASQ